jgi:hypothetical protein
LPLPFIFLQKEKFAMNLFAKKDDAPKSQADLIYEAQNRKILQFNTNVAISWVVLILFILFLFSGQNFAGIKTINLDTAFMKENLLFIAGGLAETIKISLLSIMLASILALLAALGRLSTIPPIYALSTFYVSLLFHLFMH